MPKTVIGKSGRKPLSNISNSVYLSKRRKSSAKEAYKDTAKDQCDGGSLSRLHTAHSSLCRLVNQIDGLVARAHKLNLAHKLVECDMECFIKVLLEMHLTLQAWLPKFEQASDNLSETVDKQRVPSSPPVSSSLLSEENLISLDDSATKTLEPSLSPSPLVSWPAGVKNDSERELFCLTPMPASRAFCMRSKVFPALELTKPVDKGELISMVKAPLSTFQNPNQSPLEMEVMTPQIPQSLVSKYSNCKLSDSSREDPPRNLASPGFEMSPPKTCLLLRPVSESIERGQDDFIELTPVNVRIRKFDEIPSSEELESQIPKSLMTKYPELFQKGAQDSALPTTRVQTSPRFAISPPKSCVLLMPPSEVPLNSQGETEILKPHERDKISTSSDFSITFSPSVHCTEPGETEAAVGQEKVTEEILMDNQSIVSFEASPVPLLNSKLMHIKPGTEKSLEYSCVATFTSGGIQKGEYILSDVTEPCDNPVSVLSVMATPERTPIFPKLIANAEQIVRQPGEQTLRRELWSKLEEESADMPYVFPEVRKDVLSMLDEMSLETNCRINSISQLQSLHNSFPLRKGGIFEDGSITLGTLSTRISLHNTKDFPRSCLGDKPHKEGRISTPAPTMRDQEKSSESYPIWKTTSSNCKMSRLTKTDHIQNKASGMLLRAKKTCAHLKTSER